MNSGIVVLMKHVEKNDFPVLVDALGIPPVFRWGIFTRLGLLTGPLTVVTIFMFFFFLRSMYNETVLRFGFCDIQNNEGLYIYIYTWIFENRVSINIKSFYYLVI